MARSMLQRRPTLDSTAATAAATLCVMTPPASQTARFHHRLSLDFVAASAAAAFCAASATPHSARTPRCSDPAISAIQPPAGPRTPGVRRNSFRRTRTHTVEGLPSKGDQRRPSLGVRRNSQVLDRSSICRSLSKESCTSTTCSVESLETLSRTATKDSCGEYSGGNLMSRTTTKESAVGASSSNTLPMADSCHSANEKEEDEDSSCEVTHPKEPPCWTSVESIMSMLKQDEEVELEEKRRKAQKAIEAAMATAEATQAELEGPDEADVDAEINHYIMEMETESDQLNKELNALEKELDVRTGVAPMTFQQQEKESLAVSAMVVSGGKSVSSQSTSTVMSRIRSKICAARALGLKINNADAA